MWFIRFIKACRKYKFTFVLSTYNKLKLTLRPNNTFEKIEIVEEYYCYKKLFKRAIKKIKEYRA